MLQDEGNDRPRIFQAVWMMADAGFGDDRNRTTEFLVAFLDQPRILVDRNDIVRITADVQERHFGLGQPLQVVYRV